LKWSQDGTWDRVLAALRADAETAGDIDWRVSVDSTISRAHNMVRRHAGRARGRRRAQGAPWNDKNPRRRQDEPDDHAIGRSRGGLTSKTHALVDGKGRLLCCSVSPGQAGDSPVLPELLAELRVNSHLPGRSRTTPISLCGDKAYSSRGHRALLRSRGIRAVIPEPADQVANRKRRGCAGGRPVSFDAEDYKHRNVVEQRFFNRMKNWRGLASRYDKLAVVFRGSVVLAAIVDWLR
jgi:transposase